MCLKPYWEGLKMIAREDVVLATLKSSRELCIEMRELLDANRSVDHLTDVEMEDWQSLSLDILALDRVIEYYGG